MITQGNSEDELQLPSVQILMSLTILLSSFSSAHLHQAAYDIFCLVVLTEDDTLCVAFRGICMLQSLELISYAGNALFNVLNTYMC